ncbi:MAG: enoyl-CoA hydratase/isomerase family protein [Nitrospinota bacterium]
MSEAAVLVQVEDTIATLTLNRPEHRNAINRDMAELLRDHLRELSSSEDLRLLILRGAGEDFSVGRDREAYERQLELSPWEQRRVFQGIILTNRLLYEFPAPTLAVAQGRIEGAGAGLTLNCDMVVAAENATLRLPEIDAGIPPAIIIAKLPRLMPTRKAFELVALGCPISATEAMEYGLVNRVFPPGQLDDGVEGLKRDFLDKTRVSLRLIKQSFREMADLGYEQALRHAVPTLASTITHEEIREATANALKRKG